MEFCVPKITMNDTIIFFLLNYSQHFWQFQTITVSVCGLTTFREVQFDKIASIIIFEK